MGFKADTSYLPRCHAERKELIERHPWERLRELLLDESDEGQPPWRGGAYAATARRRACARS